MVKTIKELYEDVEFLILAWETFKLSDLARISNDMAEFEERLLKFITDNRKTLEELKKNARR